MPQRVVLKGNSLFGALLVTLSVAPAGFAQSRGDEARELVRSSIAVLGGDRFTALHAIRLTGASSEELLGISPAQGPAVPMYRSYSELRDLDHLRLRRSSAVTLPMRPDSLLFTEVVDSAAALQGSSAALGAGSRAQRDEGFPWIQYGIERALPAALADPGLRRGADTTIAGHVAATVITGAGNVRIFIDRDSRLPLAIEVTQSFEGDPTWGAWGDVRTLTQYGAWGLFAGGIRYPLLQVTSRNGRPLRRVAVRRLELDPEVSEDSFPFTDSLRTAFRARDLVALGTGATAPRLLSASLGFIPGPFNVFVARQGRDFIVLGAPHSSGWTRLVLEQAERWFPGGKPVAVVVGSGTWPHLAGIREYIARGVPIYASREVARLIKRLAAGLNSIRGDSLSRSPRVRIVRVVDSTVTIRNGNDTVQLFANRGRGAIHLDQLVAYLSEDGTLYAADLLRPERFEPNLWLEPLAELRDLVQQHGIQPRSVIAFHVVGVAWTEATAPLIARENATH